MRAAREVLQRAQDMIQERLVKVRQRQQELLSSFDAQSFKHPETPLRTAVGAEKDNQCTAVFGAAIQSPNIIPMERSVSGSDSSPQFSNNSHIRDSQSPADSPKTRSFQARRLAFLRRLKQIKKQNRASDLRSWPLAPGVTECRFLPAASCSASHSSPRFECSSGRPAHTSLFSLFLAFIVFSSS